MRITNAMLMRNMMQNINTNLGRLEKLQRQMATGKKIQVPSDDPIIAARALKLRTDVSEIEQFKRNVDDALSWLETTETAIANLGDIIQRARELTVQASNGTLSEEERLSIKAEISQLKNSLIEIGNTAYAGRYIFAGFSTDKPPFEVDSSNPALGDKLIYNGKLLNPNGPILADVDDAVIQAYYESAVGNTAGQPELCMANFNKFTTGATPMEFSITLDGITQTISLDPFTTYSFEPLAAGETDIISALQSKIDAAFPPVTKTFSSTGDVIMVSPIKVSRDGNRIKFTVQEGNSIRLNDVTDGTLQTLGFADGAESSTNRKQEIIYQIGVGNNIKINVEGYEIFGKGLQGLFDTFNKLEWALDGKTEYKTISVDASGNIEVITNSLDISALIGDLDADFERLLKVRADVGARTNFVEMTAIRLVDSLVNFTELMSKNEDVDMAEVIMKLTTEENVYRASLAAGARLIQPTLLDFLS